MPGHTTKKCSALWIHNTYLPLYHGILFSFVYIYRFPRWVMLLRVLSWVTSPDSTTSFAWSLRTRTRPRQCSTWSRHSGGGTSPLSPRPATTARRASTPSKISQGPQVTWLITWWRIRLLNWQLIIESHLIAGVEYWPHITDKFEMEVIPQGFNNVPFNYMLMLENYGSSLNGPIHTWACF